MPTVHVLQGPDKGRTYQTPGESAVIGRSSEQIQLSDNSTSRRHAEIRSENGVWVLADLQSSNGTYLNGQRILRPTVLKHGDQIRVGGTLLVFSGQEHIESYSGAQIIQDLVDLEIGAANIDASILSTVDAAGESVILQPPETADAVAAWNTVYRIAEAIGSPGSIDAFLERVSDVVNDQLVVDRFVLLMRHESSDEFVPQVVRFRTVDRNAKPKIVTSRTIINHVLLYRDGVLCANAMSDLRFTEENKHDSIHKLGLRSILCVPITAGDHVYGIIHLDCSMSHHTYTHEQLRLMVAVGKLAGMAIENSRLLDSRVRNERLAATGETVAFLSHHIRNILQGIQSGAEVVEMGLRRSSLETARTGWALVRRNLDRTYHLAMNMLTFSKDRRPSIAPIQLNRLVEEVVLLVQQRADEKAVMILTELEDMPMVPMDPEGMHQVALNLIINAIEAAPSEQGRINVRTRFDAPGGHALLSIQDNGPGIPPDELETMFDVFHSSKGHGGTGLGLAAANKIVSELGGAIQVESNGRDGTTMTVILRSHESDPHDGDESGHLGGKEPKTKVV